MNPKLTGERLSRRAIVYICQSSPGQVIHNQESTRRQYALADRARELGLHDVGLIDDDLGRTGSGLMERPGFQRLVGEVCTVVGTFVETPSEFTTIAVKRGGILHGKESPWQN